MAGAGFTADPNPNQTLATLSSSANRHNFLTLTLTKSHHRQPEFDPRIVTKKHLLTLTLTLQKHEQSVLSTHRLLTLTLSAWAEFVWRYLLEVTNTVNPS